MQASECRGYPSKGISWLSLGETVLEKVSRAVSVDGQWAEEEGQVVYLQAGSSACNRPLGRLCAGWAGGAGFPRSRLTWKGCACL